MATHHLLGFLGVKMFSSPITLQILTKDFWIAQLVEWQVCYLSLVVVFMLCTMQISCKYYNNI